jgi:hypothetical protein
MKKTYFFIALLFFSTILFAQTNQQQAILKNWLGNYEGYQESYSMGQIYGRDVIVPGITYRFKLSNGNKVKLNQVGDNGKEASYSGSYKISNKNNIITVSCQMIEDGLNKYPSKPKYFIIIDNNTKKVICQQDSDHAPSFLLNKIDNQ